MTDFATVPQTEPNVQEFDPLRSGRTKKVIPTVTTLAIVVPLFDYGLAFDEDKEVDFLYCPAESKHAEGDFQVFFWDGEYHCWHGGASFETIQEARAAAWDLHVKLCREYGVTA